jgi:hypothetical protein
MCGARVVFNIPYGALTFLFLRALNSVAAFGCCTGIEGQVGRLCSIRPRTGEKRQKPGCGGEIGNRKLNAGAKLGAAGIAKARDAAPGPVPRRLPGLIRGWRLPFADGARQRPRFDGRN